jgi:hypothetical protein
VTTWVRCFWGEEDVWFYFELDADGYVIRQVELQEPGSKARPLPRWPSGKKPKETVGPLNTRASTV